MAWQTKYIVGDGAKGHHRFTLTVTEDSTNINTNQSYISWSFVLSPIVTSYDWYYSNQVPVTWSYTINGVPYSGNIMNYDGYSTVTISSGGMYIDHEANGYKDITFSFSIWSLDVYYLPGSASASGSMSLTYIPRQATITSAPNFTDEENPTITYSNPAGEAVTELKACIVYYSPDEHYIAEYRNDLEKTGTSYTFKLKDYEKNALYEATKDMSTPLLVRFHVTTVIGENTYWSTLDRYVTIVNAGPTISEATVVDEGIMSTAITNNPDVVINGCNYMKCTLSATANKGSTIVSKKVTCGSQSREILDDYAVFENVDSGTFIFTVVDSRGNETSIAINKEFVAYHKPTCNIDVDMSVIEDTKAKATITINGTLYIYNFGSSDYDGNMGSVYYRYKNKNGEYCDWLLADTTSCDPNYSYEITISDLDYQSLYSFQAKIEDRIYYGDNAILSVEYAARTVPVFDWGENDFKFNVPATMQGKPIRAIGDTTRIARSYTQETDIAYSAGSYIKLFRDGSPTDLYNQNIATFNENGTITINKNMLALINIHIISYNNNTNKRSWIKLWNYNESWQYSSVINYGDWTTPQITTVLNLTEGTVLGVITAESTIINSGGPTGSYIEIIEL